MRTGFSQGMAALAALIASAGCQATPGAAAPPPQVAVAETALPPAAKLAPPEPGIPPHVHIEDVIYGRKYGLSLTLDVFQPVHPNGAAIVALDTGGWVTDYDHIWAGNYVHYLERGYTIFHVVHGCSPKFTVPEQVSDVRRAVKFIRHHAADYHIDPARVGITGGSTGGHLAVMMGVTDTADPESKDPVERMSSRVQAVGCFAPLTDLTHVRWPPPGVERPAELPIGAYAFFDFMEKPRSRILMGKGDSPGISPGVAHLVTDADKNAEIIRTVSPVLQVSAAAAPTMIIQGEKDKVVPLEKTQRFAARLSEFGVPNKVVVVPGAGHNLGNVVDRTVELADWFDLHLKPRGAPAAH